MRHRLHSEVVYATRLKDWDFVCDYERAPRAIREKLARSSKRRSRQLLKTEIDTFEDDHFPYRKSRRARRYPWKCIRISGGGGESRYSVNVWFALRLSCRGFLEELRLGHQELLRNGEDLRHHLDALAAKYPTLRSFPVRFLNCARAELPGWEVLS